MPAPVSHERPHWVIAILFAFSTLTVHAQQPPSQTAPLPVQTPSEQLPGRIDRSLERGTYGDLSRPLGSVINRIDLPQLPGEAPSEAAKPEANPCDGSSKDKSVCKR
jgi:hypothetical protein